MNTWVDVAGWVLVHFVWQGAFVGATAIVALRLLRRRSPQARYAAMCVALVAMLAAPPLTAFVLTRQPVKGQTLPPQLFEVKWPVNAGMAPVGPGDSDGPAAPPRNEPTISRASAGLEAWLPLVVTVWLIGVSVLIVRLAGGWWHVRRLHRASMISTSSRWTTAASRIAATLNVHRLVRIVDSALVDTPTVIGWITPVILLPIAALASLTPAQVEAILAHEIAHIRRHDVLVNLLQAFAETVLFYHPAVWWVSARIREEREHCCDLVATSVSGDAMGYAEALVELERWRVTQPPLAVAATGGVLLARIRRVLGAPADDAPRAIGGISMTVIALMIVGLVGATHYLRAEQPGIDGKAIASQASINTDATAWHMVFNQNDSQMRFIGFRGRDLIRFAYQIPAARIIGGPGWMDKEILRLAVTLDEAPRADEMPALVRRTLEERLQLRTHIEQRNFPVLALVRAGSAGPNLRVSTRECFDLQEWIDAGQPPRVLPPAVPRQPVCGEEAFNAPIGRTSYVAISMAQLAEELRGVAQDWPSASGVGMIEVVDRTGMTGRYDLVLSGFRLPLSAMGRIPALAKQLEPFGLTSWPRALEDQLGLTLVESEAPYDVIVIDHAERPAK